MNDKFYIIYVCTSGYPTPKLICPENMIVELHPNETLETNVKIKRPKTDVNWERDVLTEPFWAKKDMLALKVGKTNITYIAKHPISKLTSSCNFSINVLGKHIHGENLFPFIFIIFIKIILCI